MLKEQLLIEEYKSLNEMTKYFFSVRAIILGISIATAGGMLQHVYMNGNTSTLVLDAALFMVVIGASKMLRSIIRASYVFQIRISQIAESAESIDYWTVWPHYAKRRPQDSGISAFATALDLMYFIVLIHLLVQSSSHYYLLLAEDSSIGDLAVTTILKATILPVLAIAVGRKWWTDRTVADMQVFQPKIAEAWKEAFRDAAASRNPDVSD